MGQTYYREGVIMDHGLGLGPEPEQTSATQVKNTMLYPHLTKVRQDYINYIKEELTRLQARNKRRAHTKKTSEQWGLMWQLDEYDNPELILNNKTPVLRLTPNGIRIMALIEPMVQLPRGIAMRINSIISPEYHLRLEEYWESKYLFTYVKNYQSYQKEYNALEHNRYLFKHEYNQKTLREKRNKLREQFKKEHIVLNKEPGWPIAEGIFVPLSYTNSLLTHTATED